MSTTDFLWTRTPIQGADIPYSNASGVAITAGMALVLDTAHLIGTGQGSIGLKVAPAAAGGFAAFVACENVPIGGQGKAQTAGIAVVYADGAVTVNTFVGTSATTAGQVTTYTATDFAMGLALNTTTTAADPLLLLMNPCRNA
jgi:hypothetical protein